MTKSKNRGIKKYHVCMFAAVAVEVVGISFAYYANSYWYASFDALMFMPSLISFMAAYYAALLSREHDRRVFLFAIIWIILIAFSALPPLLIGDFSLDWSGYTF